MYSISWISFPFHHLSLPYQLMVIADKKKNGICSADMFFRCFVEARFYFLFVCTLRFTKKRCDTIIIINIIRVSLKSIIHSISIFIQNPNLNLNELLLLHNPNIIKRNKSSTLSLTAPQSIWSGQMMDKPNKEWHASESKESSSHRLYYLGYSFCTVVHKILHE